MCSTRERPRHTTEASLPVQNTYSRQLPVASPVQNTYSRQLPAAPPSLASAARPLSPRSCSTHQRSRRLRLLLLSFVGQRRHALVH